MNFFNESAKSVFTDSVFSSLDSIINEFSAVKSVLDSKREMLYSVLVERVKIKFNELISEYPEDVVFSISDGLNALAVYLVSEELNPGVFSKRLNGYDVNYDFKSVYSKIIDVASESSIKRGFVLSNVNCHDYIRWAKKWLLDLSPENIKIEQDLDSLYKSTFSKIKDLSVSDTVERFYFTVNGSRVDLVQGRNISTSIDCFSLVVPRTTYFVEHPVIKELVFDNLQYPLSKGSKIGVSIDVRVNVHDVINKDFDDKIYYSMRELNFKRQLMPSERIDNLLIPDINIKFVPYSNK